jgi:hypothetical protein
MDSADPSQELLDTLLDRQLLDMRSFGMWIRDSLKNVRLAQLPVVLDQLERTAALFFQDRLAGTCIVTAVLLKLREVCRWFSRKVIYVG